MAKKKVKKLNRDDLVEFFIHMNMEGQGQFFYDYKIPGGFRKAYPYLPESLLKIVDELSKVNTLLDEELNNLKDEYSIEEQEIEY